MADEKIIFPKSIYDKLASNKVEIVEVNADSLLLKSLRENYRYRLNWLWWVIPTVLSLFLFYLSYFTGREIDYLPIYYVSGGDLSLADWVLILINFVSLPVFLSAYIAKHKEFQVRLTKRIYLMSVPILLISWLYFMTLVLNMAFYLISIMFVGARFNELTSLFLILPTVGAINYLAIRSLNNFTVPRAINTLVFAIIGGVISSIMTSGKDNWWRSHFSSLGSASSSSNLTFNLTLIIVGILLALIFDYCVTQLSLKFTGFPWQLRFLRILLVLCALSVSGVGLFPNNGNRAGGLVSQIHNLVAGLIVLFLVLVMVGISWFLPMLTRDFMIYTYAMLAVLLTVAGLFYLVRYISLTSFELLSFLIAFIWIFSFIDKMRQLALFDKRVYLVVSEETE